ncbi:unnamed protein product [Spirodela intermedia]|uniref:C2 domain-containing protein n=1 Tax=Spirodela intermedia TaxID=51605 RepID=A0A7I8LLU9_SPIIN|nr:unnamed protein product [Spirodela intermedia]
MKGGVLEVLLVNADGLGHSHLMGCPGLYVILKCGNQTHRGKVSSGKDKRVWWNEKFSFAFATRKWNSLTRLRMTIMKSHALQEDSPIGEATVHLVGVLEEGSRRGCVDLQPAPYNLVLPDGTYEGQIRIGLKFIAEVQPTTPMTTERREEAAAASEGKPQLIYRALFRFAFWRLSWPRMQQLFRGCGDSKEDDAIRGH